jgi:tRNA dimethylallyltransferase
MRLSVDSAGAEVRVICGPTAAGKSSIANWLAQREPTAIISADSRQIYRGFDIGTAKPTPEEQARVPHRGIGVVDPTRRYSAAAWAAAADSWLEEVIAERRAPIVVGGTGLYLRALFDGLFAEPEMDARKRGALEAALAQFELPELRRWAERLDHARAHLGRTQLLRGVEIALLAGVRVSELHREQATSSRWRPRYLVVDPGPALAERIVARLDDMLDHGWPDEVERLMQTVPPDAPAWNATGYDTVRRMIRGELTRAATREAILIQTRQYAKRQRTWFRHQLPAERVTRIDPLSADWRETVAHWAGLGSKQEVGA